MGDKIRLVNCIIGASKIKGKQATRVRFNVGSSLTLVCQKFVPVLADIEHFVEMRNMTH